MRSILKRVKKPWESVREIRDVFLLSGKIAPASTLRFWRSFARGLALSFRHKYLPEEAFRFGLYNPDMPRKELSKFVSKKRLMKLQRSLNPRSWAYLTEDKSIFYMYIKALGVPSPRLHAVFFKSTPGWSLEGFRLESKEDWIRYFEQAPLGEFVIKPCRGVFGRKVMMFSSEDGGFRDAKGLSRSPDNLFSMMNEDTEYDHYVIQERLVNHPAILSLTGTPFLQTLRVVTFIDRRGDCRILQGSMKLVCGSNYTDNFSSGRSGNMLAPVCLETGTLGVAKARQGQKPAFQDLAIHPVTGRRIVGFQIPFWEDCCALTRETSLKLSPIRTIGWDVAITPEGPMIIEANMFWNPPNPLADMGAIMAKMNE